MENDKSFYTPSLFKQIKECTSGDEWLEEVDKILKERGYKKYKQNFKNEDYAYWKSFSINGNKAYQVGLLFYDFRKYQSNFALPQTISIQFECMFIDVDARIDLSVSKNMTLDEFEIMSNTFYNAMLKYV